MDTGKLLIGGVSLGFAYVIVKAIQYVMRKRKFGKVVDCIPGEPRHWLYGSGSVLNLAPEQVVAYEKEMVEKYPKLYRIWFGPAHVYIILTHPATAKELLKENEPKVFNGDGYRELIPFVGEGLVMAHGPKWRRNRRLLTPAFHFETLKRYWDIKLEAIDVLIDCILNERTNGSIEVFNRMSLCTLNILLRCAFSDTSDVQRQGMENSYVETVSRISYLLWCKLSSFENEVPEWVYRYFTKNGRECYRLCDFVHKVADDVIKTRKQQLYQSDGKLETNKKTLDFLDILLAARDSDGNGLTDREIRDEVDTFMFAGHDTTATAISWILYTLACHPEHQERVYDEVSGVLTDEDSHDVLNLPYLTRCIKESLRLHCPVPYIGRVASKDLTIGGYTIPKGGYATISIYAVHHNPVVWENPEEFQPDRFLPENQKNHDPFAFIPFSAGARNCIGQNFAMHEIKLIVAKLIHRFKVSLDVNHKVIHFPLIVMKAKDGIKLHFHDR